MKLNKFEKMSADYIGLDNLKRIQSVTVGIAGAGGLGSNCAAHLVRCGFRKLRIIDFDVVEYSNLNRQFYFADQIGKRKIDALTENLRRINPALEIKTCAEKISARNIIELFADCDIVAEAFDRAEDKSMLVSELIPTGKFVVSVSGLAGYADTDLIQVHRISENLVLIGDLESSVGAARPPLSPRVAVAAAKQANVILRYVIEKWNI
ncbi:sulfur carrier protein ThiS adenylyltransferase ThiF [bacterium]|nr:sulfur carrier protein ThiS adenylyltransferase ThiF [Candidatus Omnitrophota bacterium]MBU2527909.1 sulfur carrier protein ThiS adenylyltransferase ThiF [bacterium]MBU3929262.1 sulfur carrier protein ThiS adenylyltransferase ThiF [bacterium]MBU4123596.1 sulfur carrier protein ThiS adenylyltransferase ThiF [bacterium]